MAAGHISDAFADIIVDAVLTRDITNLPSSYFFGLTLELPTDSNGTGLVPPTPAEYSRVEVVAQNASWASSGVGSRMMVSNVDIVFPVAVSDWGNIKGYTIYDSLTDGLFLGYGTFSPYVISSNMRARLPAGLVAVSLPF